MSNVLTVMNMKGGVGKTTVAMHIAGAIGKFNFKKLRKVLLIDYDPQFNLSQAFIPAKKYFSLEKERKTTLSILLDDDSKLDPYQIQIPGNHIPPSCKSLASIIYSKSDISGGLDIIPSTLDLMYVALGQIENKTKPMEERFEKFISDARKSYDLVVIDCHPAGSLFTKTSLRNSDHVLIPVVAESAYAIRGIGLMLNFIKAKKAGEKSPTPHILLNMTPRFGHTPNESRIRTNPDVAKLCMANSLKRFKAFSEPEGGNGFVWNSGKPYSTEAFRNLIAVTSELVTRTGI